MTDHDGIKPGVALPFDSLTAAEILAAIRKGVQQIQDDHRLHPCLHAVNPKALGWTTCGMCGAPVYVP